MDYQWHYDRLIETRKGRLLEKGKYYENHHIIPKSMGGDNSSINFVQLTAREHFIAHWLLWRIYRNRSTSFAFYALCRFGKNRKKQWTDFTCSSRAYEEAKLVKSEFGFSDESCLNMSLHQKGKIWINDTQKSLRINKEQLEDYVSNGWIRGRIDFSVEARKNMSISQLDKVTPEHVKAKIRLSNIGKHSESLKGNKNHLNCKHSAESKELMRNKKIGKKRKAFTTETKEKMKTTRKLYWENMRLQQDI